MSRYTEQNEDPQLHDGGAGVHHKMRRVSNETHEDEENSSDAIKTQTSSNRPHLPAPLDVQSDIQDT